MTDLQYTKRFLEKNFKKQFKTVSAKEGTSVTTSCGMSTIHCGNSIVELDCIILPSGTQANGEYIHYTVTNLSDGIIKSNKGLHTDIIIASIDAKNIIRNMHCGYVIFLSNTENVKGKSHYIIGESIPYDVCKKYEEAAEKMM